MKKGIWVVFIIALFLAVCETGIEINLSTIKVATSNIIKFESGLLGTKSTGLITIAWRWAVRKPEAGDGIIVQRSSDGQNFVDVETLKVIDTAMTFKTSDSSYVLPGSKLHFKLNFLNGMNIEPFDTIEINTLSEITYLYPNQDTVRKATPDSITVTWKTAKDKAGVVLKDYKVEIFQGKVSTNIDSVLNLINPLDSKEVTGVTDTIASCTFATDSTRYPFNNIYTIKVALKTPVTEVIPGKALTLTDYTLGVRAFFLLRQ